MKKSQCPSKRSTFIPLSLGHGNGKPLQSRPQESLSLMSGDDEPVTTICPSPSLTLAPRREDVIFENRRNTIPSRVSEEEFVGDNESNGNIKEEPSIDQEVAQPRKALNPLPIARNATFPINFKTPLIHVARLEPVSEAAVGVQMLDRFDFSRYEHPVQQDGRAELQRDSGEVVGKASVRLKGSEDLIGSTVFVGSNECEIVKMISEDEYVTKGLDQAAARATSKPIDSKPFSLKKRPANGQGLSLAKQSSCQDDKTYRAMPTAKYSIDPSRQGSFVINDPSGPDDAVVVIDPVVGIHLKPHQVEGVRFLFRSLHRGGNGQNGEIKGCILADEMGLGKTLQTIALIWALLKQSVQSAFQPTIKKAIIVCPSSLVFNWCNEFKRWLGEQRVPVQTITQGGNAAQGAVNDFVLGNVKKVCIISYDMVRRHIATLKSCTDIQLLVCDEGHRLKNIDGNATIDALNSLPCRKRILLSGTPVQNDLDEFYAMVNFVSPGLLGDARSFRILYADSIIKSRDKASSDDQRRIGRKRLEELNKRTAPMILRRTSEHIAAQLPPKVSSLHVCGQMMSNADYRKAIEGGSGQVVLSLIAKVTKVLNHPDLLLTNADNEEDQIVAADEASAPKVTIDCSHFFPANHVQGVLLNSGKLNFLFQLLEELHGRDRVVIVSNYTTTLQLLENMCKSRSYRTVRLDGSTEMQKRSDIVQSFNSPHSDQFIFLLSSKAGGCGLNLTGANRIVLLDPSWNPAHDAQAMARVWRFGQTKKVFIYRLLTTGTMEEKIFQKQIKKGEFEQLVVDHKENVCRNFEGNLRDIFILRSDTISDTYDVMSKSTQKTSPESREAISIAGYVGSRDVSEAAVVCGDSEFSSAISKLCKGAVTFLLTKEVQKEEASERVSLDSATPTEQDPSSTSESSNVEENKNINHGCLCPDKKDVEPGNASDSDDFETRLGPKKRRVRAVVSDDELSDK